MPPILARLFILVLPAALVYGCTVGELSPQTHMALNSRIELTPPEKVAVIGLAADVPLAQIGSRCTLNTWRGENPEHSKPIFAVRPGVGTRVSLATWSAGTLRAVLGSGNSSPPELTPTKISLRLIGEGDRLDPEELAVLATFLTANRTEWSSGPPTEAYPVSADSRRLLVEALESNQSSLWNAFVRSMCIEVRETEPMGVSAKIFTLRAVGDMAALCNTLPADSRKAFVATFIDTRAAVDNPDCANWIVNRSLNGVGLLVDTTAWPSAILAVEATGGDMDYYDSGRLGSPKALFGEIEFDAVRPMERGAPHWSLAAWEASGICRLGGKEAHIDAVLLRGGSTYLEVVDNEPTYQIIDRHVARDLERIKGANPFKARILRSDLRLLTAADVRELRWKAGTNDVNISGCDRAGK